MIPTRLPYPAAMAALALAAGFAAEAQPAAAPPVPAPSASAYRPIAPAGDVLATLQASGEFTTLVKAVGATNLTQIFKAQPNITVLAPTDAAFAALPPDQLASLMANIPQLQKLVTYHLINTRLASAQIKGHAATAVPTVANAPVTVDGSGAGIKVNDANVIQADVMASNGVILVIDKVLTPGGATPAAAAVPAAPATPSH